MKNKMDFVIIMDFIGENICSVVVVIKFEQ